MCKSQYTQSDHIWVSVSGCLLSGRFTVDLMVFILFCRDTGFCSPLYTPADTHAPDLSYNHREHIYNVTKDLYFKQMLFFWTFYSSVNTEK